ncbi:MAG TPA: hypothetical protein VFU81_11145, partial [Thermomicrobiales bacterium]|nr:hypothetical protein [Thermomicrobiales bacterium]
MSAPPRILTSAADREAGSARPSRRVLRQFARNRGAVAGVVILVALCLVAVVGPRVVGDPIAQHVLARLAPPGGSHPFGTDELGRDVFSRVVNGTPISLL